MSSEPQKNPDLLTYQEASSYLGKPSKTGSLARKLVKRKRIKAIVLSYGVVRIHRLELDRLKKSCETAVIH